jgi:phosphoglycerol transferase MdoB-like AlkP superfamily enzyme
MPGLTALFLLTTVLTSVTGFMFPISGFSPALAVGVISMVMLAIALFAIYAKRLAGAWRWIYVVTAATALWFNVFVLIAQSFLKVSAIHALAPNGNEPPFLIAQGITLVVFIVLAAAAAARFRPSGLASAVAY